MHKTLIRLILSSLFYAATCRAQPADAERPLNAPPDRTLEQRLLEMAYYAGIDLPEKPIQGRGRDVASVLLWRGSGSITGIQFNRSGRTSTIASQMDGPLVFSHQYNASRGVDSAEDRQLVWKVLDGLQNSLDESIPKDRRLLIIGVRDGHLFGSLLDRSKLDGTIIEMLRRLPPTRGFGYYVPVVDSSVVSLGKKSRELIVASAPQLDGFVYSTRHEFHRGRWTDPTSLRWVDETVWKTPEHESIYGCAVSSDGERWLIQTKNYGSCRIHVGDRQGLDRFRFDTVIDVSSAVSCRFAANRSFAISINNGSFSGEKRSFLRLAADEATRPDEVLPASLYNLSVDGRMGVCHEEGDVVIRDLHQKLPPRVIERGVREIMSAEFSPDHSRLLLSIQKRGTPDGDPRLWKSAIYKLDKLDRPIDLFENGVAHVRLLESVWSADSSKVFGRHLTNDIIVGLNAIHVWDAADGRHLGHLLGGGSISTLYLNRAGLALCDRERFLVAGTPQGDILTWDLSSLLMPKPKEPDTQIPPTK